MAPPPPPPPSDDTTMGLKPAMLVTPPQKHKTHSYGYNYVAHGRDRRGTVTSSPATSHASSGASPLLKTRSAGEVLSPRLRGSRMDPYPRYSPRKRLSADFSDGTYSADSGVDSPKSEKSGWRIHAAVAGPFLTGPLAEDFTARLDELRSPRGKKTDEPDFDHNGLLLFPVVPDFVAPAITPEVFQASIQPAPITQTQPQPEPDYSAVAPPSEACYYPQHTDQYYALPPATDALTDASWDASAQMQQQQSQESYYYAEQQQQYSAEQEQYYYNNGYDQYNSAAYTNGEYGYQQTYEQYPVSAEQSPVEVAETLNTEAFPPLPSHSATTPEIDTPSTTISDDFAASNQVAEAATTSEAVTVPGSPIRRQRAPSYAEIVTGAAHTTPAVPEQKAPKVDEVPKKAAAKANFATFDQLSDGIAESMSRILAKSNGNKTHAEVEFSCLVHRIQTQLKLMGRVSNSLHLKQMKTMHKLQQSEIEKLSVESSNVELLSRVKKYEQEQEELKKQLAEALEAKDVRLKDAVDQLSSKINTLKNSTDASTSTLASEIDAIQKCSSPDDLEKRVEEIGQVIDYLIENSSDSSSKSSPAAPKPKVETRRHSIGSWKAIALYAIVVWAASLCGVWVGVKFASSVQTTSATTYTEMQKPDVMEAPVVITEDVFVEPTPAVFEEVAAPVVEMVEAEIREVAVEIDQPASIDFTQSFVEPVVVDEVAPHTELTDDAVVTEDEEVEVSTPIEEVQDVQTPTEAVSEPSLVFTFEQVTRSSPSCFSCPSDHSTMASFFCEMLAEVMPSNSIVLEEHVPSDEISLVETSTESVINAGSAPSTEVFADAIEEAVEEIVAPVDAVVEEPSTIETLESGPISQTTGRRSVANMMSSPLAHALYVWCPSLFDMHPEEKDAASGPLSDLARALTSLSSQILSEHAPSTVEEDVDESQVSTFEIIEETHEDTVAISEVEAPMTEEVEVDEQVTEVEVADIVADVEDVEVANVEEPAVVETAAEEAVADVPSNRWAAEQLLINIGAMSGTAQVATHTASVTVAEVEEAVEAWSFPAETAVSFFEEEAKFVNSSAVEVVPSVPVAEVAEVPEVASTETVDAAAEIVPVVEDAAVAVEEVVSSCSLESCPLFKDATAEEPKFANTSIPIAPTFQVVEDSAAADNEISEAIGSSPALDLKSVLLNSL